jgi:drug/metabolite transporter (DMT)-like permease
VTGRKPFTAQPTSSSFHLPTSSFYLSNMFAAVLTTFFFACSVILARRSTLLVGPQPANLARQFAALLMLGLWAHLLGQGLNGPGLGVFIVSGAIGFGLGDWALFEALPRVGPALTQLICQCLAVPIAAVTERLFLGTTMTPWQIGSAAVILAGVAIAMAPERGSVIPRGHRVAGIIFAVVAAFGQAWGAVISRYGFKLDDQAGLHVDGATTAYQRLWGGIICIALLVWCSRLASRWMKSRPERPPRQWKRAMPWIVGNALAGPTLGVSCYQWALHAEKSAVVLPIVATTPLAVTVLVFLFQHERPTPRVLAGSVLAVAGVIAMVRSIPH